MKSIKIVTLAVPLLSGCQLLNWVGHSGSAVSNPAVAVDPVAVVPSPAPAASGEKIVLRKAPALAAERDFELDAVKAETRFGDAEFSEQQAKGLAGDANAAMHVAKMYGQGSNGLPRDERAMVLWLKHASLLEHGGASYQLYLYYLARGRDRDAVRYERRAVRQGYTLPARLDNRRG